MSGLLTSQQLADIRAAIGDVTDTFFVTPVSYQLVGQSLDRFQEDRADRIKATFALHGLVEYPDGSVKEETGGAIDTANVKVSFNMDDLSAVAGVTDGNLVVFNATKDYMLIEGKQYETTFVKYDGPLERKNVLCLVYANLVKQKG